MKEQALSLLKAVFPDGIEDPNDHRDVIRSFVLGWNAALNSVPCSPEQIGVSREEVELVSSVGWMPDASWRWW